ncbi:Uncharacterized protein Fot_31909 [Forsythia ovata]|uniref:Uncharacterized protein n=1 Tax=Forsythia ovata TaxID=205694 RepID=A0ABD1T6D7_9LAMI
MSIRMNHPFRRSGQEILPTCGQEIPAHCGQRGIITNEIYTELRRFTPDRPTSTDRKNCSLKTSPIKVHLVEEDHFKMVAIAAFIQQFRKMKDKLEEIGALQGHLNLAEQLSKYADFTRDYD